MSTTNHTVKTTVGASENQPEITRHEEPPEQGGATYYRCERGREAMRRKDLRSEYHREECTARERSR